MSSKLVYTVLLCFSLLCSGLTKSFFYKCFPLGRLLVVRLLYGCMLEPIGSVLTGLVGCPLMSLLLLAKGIIRLCVRHTWDAFMFHAIIKPRARVPASDSWIARRISGTFRNYCSFHSILCL